MERHYIHKAFNAVQMDEPHYVKEFIESGGNINERMNGTSLVGYAIIYNKHDILQYLIENRALTSTSDLIIAVENGRTKIIDYLLKHCPNIDVNFADCRGDTILMRAVTMSICFLRGDDHIGIIQCLIDNGADVNKKNIYLEGPLEKAATYYHPLCKLDGRIVDLLIQTSNMETKAEAFTERKSPWCQIPMSAQGALRVASRPESLYFVPESLYTAKQGRRRLVGYLETSGSSASCGNNTTS